MLDVNNPGYEVEDRMRRWFRGKRRHLDCVDFETKNCLWEVKSVGLFYKSKNHGHNRKCAGNIPCKNVESFHLSRFILDLSNHEDLKALADKEKKLAKYVFVIRIGKQLVFRVVPWEKVPKKRLVRIKDVFLGGLG